MDLGIDNVIRGFSAPEHRFLSNFEPAVVKLDGVDFPTVEHAYQAAKSTDGRERLDIRDLRAPGQAKRAGRQVTMRPDWDRVKVMTMHKLLEQKFTHEHLRELLLLTGDAQIVEFNTWGDRFWGVTDTGGDNVLGRLLMDVRRDINEGKI